MKCVYTGWNTMFYFYKKKKTHLLFFYFLDLELVYLSKSKWEFFQELFLCKLWILFLYFFFLYTINVKTADSIWPTFFVGRLMFQEKIYRWSKLWKKSINPQFFLSLLDNLWKENAAEKATIKSKNRRSSLPCKHSV